MARWRGERRSPAGRGGAGGGGASTSAATIFYLDVGGARDDRRRRESEPARARRSAGQGPDGIAIDLAAGHIFWTGMGNPSADDGFVMRSNLDGSNVATLVPAGGTYTPKQMRVDAAGGKLYWSDREGMRVQRSNVDGSNVETLVTAGTGATARMDASNWCVGMALDTAGGWFYWTQKGGDNAGVGSIRRAHIAMPAGQTSVEPHRHRGAVRRAARADRPRAGSGGGADLLGRSRRRHHQPRADRDPGGAHGGEPHRPADPGALAWARRSASRSTSARGRLYYTGAEGQLGRANLDGSSKQELTGAGALTGIVVVDLP